MNLLTPDLNGCPFLILAPMEGVGDKNFRQAMAKVGGFDEAVRDFLRVPINPHFPSLAKSYCPNELMPIPLAAQIMGSDPEDMALMANHLQQRGAPRIDINCGCPSNTVTGRGAGSSLLKTPELLYQIAQAVVKSVNIPVTLKMRSGYEDTSLFKDNLMAAQESGICYLTLHPRTKVEGYTPPAHWDLIAKAKDILKIPVVGNGDILNVQDALSMLKITQCDALMIGRGCLINPFIFHEIRSYFSQTSYLRSEDQLTDFLKNYFNAFSTEIPQKAQINKLKQLFGFLFKATPKLLEKRSQILTYTETCSKTFLQFGLDLLREEGAPKFI